MNVIEAWEGNQKLDWCESESLRLIWTRLHSKLLRATAVCEPIELRKINNISRKWTNNACQTIFISAQNLKRLRRRKLLQKWVLWDQAISPLVGRLRSGDSFFKFFGINFYILAMLNINGCKNNTKWNLSLLVRLMFFRVTFRSLHICGTGGGVNLRPSFSLSATILNT